MGQFSAEKPVPPGSTLSGNQQIETPNTRAAYFRASGCSSPGAKAKGLEELVVIEPVKASRPTQLS